MCCFIVVSTRIFRDRSIVQKRNTWKNSRHGTIFGSTTVYAWIKPDAIRYKPFVRNKVINELHSSKVWRYVPSSRNNAADLVSKGCSRNELENIIMGPDILYSCKRDWPQMPNLKHDEEVKVESNANMLAAGVATESLMDLERVSSWRKLVGMTSYVFKLMDIVTKRTPHEKENEDNAKT